MYQKLAWNQIVTPFDFPVAQSERKAIPSEDERELFFLGWLPVLHLGQNTSLNVCICVQLKGTE